MLFRFHRFQFITMLICWFIITYPVNKLLSQTTQNYYLDDMIEQIAIDEEGDIRSVDSYIEELSEYQQNPFNINTITKTQLEIFPFLTDIQIENLLFYIYSNGPMKTIYELQLVDDMDWQTIQYLRPFVYSGEVIQKKSFPTLKQLTKYGKHQILTRMDIPLNKKAGYKKYPDSLLLDNPNKRYLGSSLYHSFRYSYRYKDQLHFGLTAEKDAGEPFFAQVNKKGYDFYSFYFLARDLGKMKTLAIGNYRLSYGLGLVINTDYSMGKSSSISTIGYKPTGIRRHSSTDEYNYFRGIATEWQIKRFRLSAFYSHKDIDAIVDNELITSIKKDGMHKISRDFERKNNAVIQMLGGNLTYQIPNLRIGLTAVYNFFNKPFIPEVKPYSIFNPRGRDFFNMGVDYRYRWKRLTLFGETAIDKGGGVATLNVLRFSPLSGYQFVLLQRHYDKRYQSWYARSVSENSEIRNEEGWYIGFEANSIKYWKLFAYADSFRFPWLKYGVDHPSSGFDGLLQTTFTPKRNLSMFLRYRYKVKDKNHRDDETDIKSVIPYHQHKIRYQLNYSLQEQFSMRTTIDFTSVYPDNVSSSKGFMLTQCFSYSFQQLPLRMDVNYGIFDTDDYASRLTIYEKGVLYAFSMPSFYGKGIRSAVTIRYDFNKKLTTIVKIAQTKYADRDEIGTTLELIQGDKKTDIYAQLIYKI